MEVIIRLQILNNYWSLKNTKFFSWFEKWRKHQKALIQLFANSRSFFKIIFPKGKQNELNNIMRLFSRWVRQTS